MDLTRELLTTSLDIQALVQHPARVSYSVGKETDFSGSRYPPFPKVDVYRRFSSWGGQLKEEIEKATDSVLVEGITPLHWAADKGASGVASVLIEVGGADMEARDSEGAKPLDAMYRSRWPGDSPDDIRDAIQDILGSRRRE